MGATPALGDEKRPGGALRRPDASLDRLGSRIGVYDPYDSEYVPANSRPVSVSWSQPLLQPSEPKDSVRG